MTTREIQARSGRLSWPLPGEEGELRCPAAKQQLARAELRAMQKRGEIAYAYNARIDPVTREYVINYVRTREPRSKVPLYVAAVTVPMAAVAGVGIMLWHARYVILAAVAVTAVVAFLIALAGAISARSSGCACVIHGVRGCRS